MADRLIEKARNALLEEKRLVSKWVDFVRSTLIFVFTVVGFVWVSACVGNLTLLYSISQALIPAKVRVRLIKP